jgi:alkylated DNA repair dioxygenase AlkB
MCSLPEEKKSKLEMHKVSESSYLCTGNIPAELLKTNFESLWELHPVEHGTIVMRGKTIEVPRWQQSYDLTYTFSGTSQVGVSLPEVLKPYSEWVNSLGFGDFNQKFVNWYSNGHHYIGPHCDDEKQIVKGSPIVSISLGQTRKFRIRHFKTKAIFHDIELGNGAVVIMGGNFQKEFTHEIVKVNGKKGEGVGKRINLTFRNFKL